MSAVFLLVNFLKKEPSDWVHRATPVELLASLVNRLMYVFSLFWEGGGMHEPNNQKLKQEKYYTATTPPRESIFVPTLRATDAGRAIRSNRMSSSFEA